MMGWSRRKPPLTPKTETPFMGSMIPPSSEEASDEVLLDRWGIEVVAFRRRAEELAASGKTAATYGEVYYALTWLKHYGHDLTDTNIISKADRMARNRQRIEQRNKER